MSNATQDHPEFFKAPADAEPRVVIDYESGFEPASETATVADDATVDELLGAAVVPVMVEGQLRAGPASNRRAGALIALLGGVIFTLFYALAAFGLIALRQPSEFIVSSTLSFLATPIFWLTAALFTGFFALLAIIVNRGPWISFVVGSFVVAVLTYGSALGAGLIAIHAWELTYDAAEAALWEGIAFSPLILVAPILAREIALWLGVWISRRGKRLSEDL
jgi:hypothetical protein